MNKLINLPVITAIVFFSVTACADWGAKSDLNPPEVCELKNGLLFSKDSILIELPYGKVVPVSYGNFSLEVYKIEGDVSEDSDVSEDICSKLTYPEVRVYVRIIQNNCREDLNYCFDSLILVINFEDKPFYSHGPHSKKGDFVRSGKI